MLVSLCSVQYNPAAALSSEPLKLLFSSADLPAGEGGSQGEGTFRLSQLPPRGAGPPQFLSFLSSYLVM